jgi:hypothetical protein
VDWVNNNGWSNILVRRTAVGRYQVRLPAAASSLPGSWGFQITAYPDYFASTNVLCKLESFDPASGTATVACRLPNGSDVDSSFDLTFAAGGSLIGRTDRAYGFSGTSYTGVTNPSTGVYDATFPGMWMAKGQAVGLATGTNSTYCHIGELGPAGPDLNAVVVCFNPGGTVANSTFLAGATL